MDLLQFTRQCKAEYLSIARRVRRDGVDKAAIQMARTQYADTRGVRWLVTQDAYLPTGVALGCPLPGKIHFFLLTSLLESILSKVAGLDPAGNQRSFIHVPTPALHITLANRSHFEHTDMLDLQPDEFEEARQVINELNLGTVRVVTAGLLLTYSGRVIVKCLPLDTHVWTLREALKERMPGTWVQVPRMIHIKLGHLAVPLNSPQILAFEGHLHRLGQHLTDILDFPDVYTPCGRIPLGSAIQ